MTKSGKKIITPDKGIIPDSWIRFHYSMRILLLFYPSAVCPHLLTLHMVKVLLKISFLFAWGFLSAELALSVHLYSVWYVKC